MTQIPIRPKRITLLLLMCALAASCTLPVPVLAPVDNIAPAQRDQPPGDALVAGTTGLTSSEAATLASLEKVDAYPLYTMQYHGDYVRNETACAPERDSLFSTDWACSLFAVLGDRDNMLFGRNFDWQYSPALLLFTDPSEGHRSVSMVDIAYLGFAGENARDLLDLPLNERRSLLRAPFLPFDGMNERGLVVGMAAVPPGNKSPDPAKDTVGSLGIMRKILDGAATVGEAVAIMEGVNIDFGGGPSVHYLIADAAGRSVLVEYYRGDMVVIPNDELWQAATNFLRSAAGATAEVQCRRHDTISSQLQTSDGALSETEAMALLADVAQPNTQWSIVYGISNGEINVAMGGDYGNVFRMKIMD
ncbi:MAG: C45 family peptidase [Chloroflexota bacterium]|nr:C45 family peptidase [Chloroflexota bacterium]